MKTFKFINSRGQVFIGDLHGNNSSKMVIVCYGRRSMRTNPIIRKAIDIYIEGGFDVFHFDPAGESAQEELDIKQRVSDTNKVIEFFSKKYKEIILGGGSLGAIVASIVAIQNKHVSKIYVVNGLFDPDSLNLILRIRIMFLLRLFPELNTQMEYIRKELKPELIKIPTLVVYSKLDFIVGTKQSLNFYRRLRCTKEILEIKLGSHKLVDRYDILIDPTKKLMKWLNDN